jgi:DNA-binding response OmpR family regulator
MIIEGGKERHMIHDPSHPRDALGHDKRRVHRGRVLLAEDHHEMRSLLASALHAEGYDVTECRDGDEFVDRIVTPSAGVDFDLIISDVRMPGHSGLDILDAGRQLEGFPPMILITAFGSDALHARAWRLGAAAVFDKPFDVEDLLATAKTLLPV